MTENSDIETAECIVSNAKYASLVKEFKLKDNLEPQRAIQFFQTFKQITCLTLERVGMSQDLYNAMALTWEIAVFS
ncbi:hypothetical protein CONCODRAFT_12302 [Conidiobolus coronatus NRRL 28638]|uniref:Uncharacterized protein n=1 Tax=Conidiobolus coronatus (strain ATCC 28846 / CBS 209.66 / NRRL 28638) TaxID=796925 RepID=A0A137NTB6_CONC2|nr:hypothetical protein CONCODRAFT_12302 [Conidiobolus coronatus NRRL 28638]|eukprot:KXN65969.1 hypothetical protein CONCODRAFT_12302 [Conidiobolus coronatus NRRL 28638]